MTIREEQFKILSMIEAGKITAGEGEKLLQALRQTDQDPDKPNLSPSTAPQPPTRRFRLVITDASGEKKVNVNLPLGLVKVGIKMGARFAPFESPEDDLKILETIKKAVEDGRAGRIVEMRSTNGEVVEIFVD